ncbi:hypothetical protein D3C71_1327280 [compost metagenome]
MTGECTQTLLNALFIAYICINGIKHTHLTAFFCRDEQPRHRHETQQSNGLECNGFTTRIRSGYNNGAILVAELHIQRNHMLRGNKWMASFAQLQIPAIVHTRLCSLHISGKTRLGEDKVKLAKNIDIISHFFGYISYKRCQPMQYDLNLPFFTQPCFTQLIIHRHNGLRLDK